MKNSKFNSIFKAFKALKGSVISVQKHSFSLINSSFFTFFRIPIMTNPSLAGSAGVWNGLNQSSSQSENNVISRLQVFFQYYRSRFMLWLVSRSGQIVCKFLLLLGIYLCFFVQEAEAGCVNSTPTAEGPPPPEVEPSLPIPVKDLTEEDIKKLLEVTLQQAEKSKEVLTEFIKTHPEAFQNEYSGEEFKEKLTEFMKYIVKEEKLLTPSEMNNEQLWQLMLADLLNDSDRYLSKWLHYIMNTDRNGVNEHLPFEYGRGFGAGAIALGLNSMKFIAAGGILKIMYFGGNTSINALSLATLPALQLYALLLLCMSVLGAVLFVLAIREGNVAAYALRAYYERVPSLNPNQVRPWSLEQKPLEAILEGRSPSPSGSSAGSSEALLRSSRGSSGARHDSIPEQEAVITANTPIINEKIQEEYDLEQAAAAREQAQPSPATTASTPSPKESFEGYAGGQKGASDFGAFDEGGNWPETPSSSTAVANTGGGLNPMDTSSALMADQIKIGSLIGDAFSNLADYIQSFEANGFVFLGLFFFILFFRFGSVFTLCRRAYFLSFLSPKMLFFMPLVLPAGLSSLLLSPFSFDFISNESLVRFLVLTGFVLVFIQYCSLLFVIGFLPKQSNTIFSSSVFHQPSIRRAFNRCIEHLNKDEQDSIRFGYTMVVSCCGMLVLVFALTYYLLFF